MTAPLADLGLVSRATGLGVAAGLGIAFGWLLERGGMGNARKLAAQFTGTDWTVTRLMFSAILTAALGLYWLGRLGVLDLSRVYVQPTSALPQIVGGVVFGAGFATAGLCPGTACVSAATGRLDGLAVVLGMLTGVFAFHLAFPLLRGFVERSAIGPITLPAVLHLPQGVVVFLLVLMALAAFAVAARIERARALTPRASGAL
jgi:uncharacterized protein